MYRFGIFGKDVRMKYLCDALLKDGYSATRLEDQSDGGKVGDLIVQSNAVILPPERGYAGIIPQCRGKTVLVGLNEQAADTDGVRILNYAESDYFKARNAVPTAEGALRLAMSMTDFTLSGCGAAVIGFGNIGSCLVRLLILLNADVSVVARRAESRAKAENLGAHVYDLSRLCDLSSDIVFNTVPAPVLSRDILSKLDRRTLIIDLASYPGGTDFEYAKGVGITAIHALGLPGKYAPVTAGAILKDTVISMLSEV